MSVKRRKTKKLELLAPAGDLEKMKLALKFGADAVYFGLPNFSLRARINKFGRKEIREGAKLCRKLGKRFYVTINIYAHNKHLKKLKKHLEFINEIKPNAIILSDPGILRIVKKECPHIAIHLSTQANATNIEAVKFWQAQGVERIILAREVTLKEMKEIKKAVPEMELEVFVHGAMCMAYSGRCILSKWMTGRSANLGDCAQPCRWAYNKTEKENNKTKKNNEENNKEMTVTDDKKRFQLKLEEDEQGTYFFNSYDLCLITHLDKLIKAGIDSFKIEGRGKSVYYVATVTRAYRAVINSLMDKSLKREMKKKIIKQQQEELKKLSHRGYWTGFIFGDEPPHLIKKAYHKTNWEFVGITKGKNVLSKKRKVFVHNAIKNNDKVEIITPTRNIQAKIMGIKNEKGEEVLSAHGGGGLIFEIKLNKAIKGTYLIRKKINLS